VIEGDIFTNPIPTGHDVVLIANVVHLFSAEHNRALLRRTRQYVPGGTRLLFVDFWTDSTHTQPPVAALMAGEFLVITGEGDVYSEEEVQGWLQETGWRTLERKPLTVRRCIPKTGHICSDTARLSALFWRHLSIRYRSVNRRLDST
jgi:hypothetical protein